MATNPATTREPADRPATTLLTKSERDALVALAQADGRSLSGYLRRVLVDHVTTNAKG